MTGRQRRGAGSMIVDPRLVLRVLEHADRSTHAAAAARFGVSIRSVTRWQQRRREEAAQGRAWPSGADVEHWQQRQPARARKRTSTQRWAARRATEGPLLIGATGTTRRLQALAALGHRYADVAAELGVTKSRARDLTVMRGADRVHRDTATAVCAVYERLSMTPGPSARCRALAANRGWPPPLAWDDDTIDDLAARPRRGNRDARVVDEVAVARAAAGDRVPLRPAERREAVRQLTDAGLSATAISERLRISPRATQRNRTRPDGAADRAPAA